MNAPLTVAGSLGIVAAAIHGIAGELFVVRQLSRDQLPTTRFGGRGMTMAMIHASWHIATAAFVTAAGALLVAGIALDGDVARGVGMVGAAGFTGFGAAAGALGYLSTRSLRALGDHVGPAILSLTAALAWWGALSV